MIPGLIPRNCKNASTPMFGRANFDLSARESSTPTDRRRTTADHAKCARALKFPGPAH